MSSYGEQMDPGESNHSLLSERGSRGSDLGSRYVMESGLCMSSFAAAIFIAALVIFGVLLLTLLVALTVMLASCENKKGGVIQEWETLSEYDYCNIFAFHAELNNLEPEEFPAICKARVNKYIKEGKYLRELNLTIQVAENYFITLKPGGNGLDVILMDLDDIFPSDIIHGSKHFQSRNELVEEIKRLPQMFTFRLYKRLQTSGWSLILFSRKPETQRSATIDSLVSAGWEGWSSLIMRSSNELSMESWAYISKIRVGLHNQGSNIVSVISSQIDALTGPCVGRRNFKLAARHWM